METAVTALVTGATGKIGKAIARRISMETGERVLLVCRDRSRAERAVAEIQAAAGEAEVGFLLADLSRPRQVLDLGARWEGPLQLLVNCAAITPRRRGETPEGIEQQFATNVLGYFWMIQAFAPHLVPGARVVNVASYWAGDLDLDDPEFRRRPYDNNRAYRQSKQADRMLSVGFAGRLAERGVAVNACHPGDVNSTLSNNLGFGGFQSPDEGADTPAWLALSSEVEGVTGRYFEHRREVHCPFAEDREGVEAVYRYCMERSGPLLSGALPLA